MDYYRGICNKFTKPKSKYEHFKSNTHKEFERCKPIELSVENPTIYDVKRIIYSWIIEHSKKYDHYLIKCQHNLISNLYQNFPYMRCI